MMTSPALIDERTLIAITSSVSAIRQSDQTMTSPALIAVRTFMAIHLPRVSQPSVAPDDAVAGLDRRANLHGNHLLRVSEPSVPPDDDVAGLDGRTDLHGSPPTGYYTLSFRDLPSRP